MSNIHTGSDFDDFLKDEGLLADVEATAIKRVVAYQIEQEMRKSNLSKTAQPLSLSTSANISISAADVLTVPAR